MSSEIPRSLDLTEITEKKSSFLFGARGAGKTSLIDRQLTDALVVDLLSGDYYLPLSQNPSELAAIVEARPDVLVVIDEVQKLPLLLDEVHRLIQKKGRRFLLGSCPGISFFTVYGLANLIHNICSSPTARHLPALPVVR